LKYPVPPTKTTIGQFFEPAAGHSGHVCRPLAPQRGLVPARYSNHGIPSLYCVDQARTASRCMRADGAAILNDLPKTQSLLCQLPRRRPAAQALYSTKHSPKTGEHVDNTCAAVAALAAARGTGKPQPPTHPGGAPTCTPRPAAASARATPHTRAGDRRAPPTWLQTRSHASRTRRARARARGYLNKYKNCIPPRSGGMQFFRAVPVHGPAGRAREPHGAATRRPARDSARHFKITIYR